MDWARSSVRVIEEMIKSIFPVLSDGMSPAKGLPLDPKFSAELARQSLAHPALIPVARSAHRSSRRGYDSSIPTTSRLLAYL